MRKLLTGLMASALLATVPLGLSRSAEAALPTTITIVGHGWGNGVGMGQYGALGYALDGWTYQEILAHYYGGTNLTSTSFSTIDVNLSELEGDTSVTVWAPAGSQLSVDGRTETSPYTVHQAAADQTITASNGADVTVSGPWSTGSERDFAGSIVMKGTGTAPAQVWNVVPLEDYVEGVVPRESPASWPAAALEAQAVAARSYAIASVESSGPAICDTTWCQVYGGDPTQYPDSYSSNSNAAVAATRGQVMDCGSDSACGSPTQVALAQFGSSTGGYTAGGPFPAVVDAGDATPSNPNHDWSTTVTIGEIEAAFPSVGTLESINVTGRNGLGDLGGRVTQMVLQGSGGTDTVTGSEFAGALGLNSNWFAITDVNPPAGSDTGYWVVATDGSVYDFGSAPDYGSMAGYTLDAPVVGMSPTGDGNGYWLVAADGGVFSFGDAKFYGSTGGMRLDAPVIGMASTRDGAGYWLLASDGGVFSFGDAKFYGSTGGQALSAPVVAMSRTPDGAGYWVVTSAGKVYTFGDARNYGDTSQVDLWQPIVGIVPTANGEGYWLVARDGGIFAYGDAGFVGSLGGAGVSSIVSVSPTPNDQGYLMISSTGRAYPFGNATYFSDPASSVSDWSGGALGIFSRG